MIILWLFNINVTVLPFGSTQGSKAPWFRSERIWVSAVIMISKMVFVDINVSVASNSFVSVRILRSPILAGYPLCCVVNSTLIVAPFRFANDSCNWINIKYVNEICMSTTQLKFKAEHLGRYFRCHLCLSLKTIYLPLAFISHMNGYAFRLGVLEVAYTPLHI